MTGPQVFALFWGILAIGLSYAFVRYPGQMEETFRKNMDRTRTTRRLRERHAPTTAIIIWYRIGAYCWE